MIIGKSTEYRIFAMSSKSIVSRKIFFKKYYILGH